MQSVVVMNEPTGVGENVKRARERVGMTQEAVADSAVVRRSHLASIETGKDNITAATMFKLADAMGVSPAVLVTGRDELPPGKAPGLHAYLTRVVRLSDHAAATLAQVVQAFKDQQEFQDTLSTALARREAAESQSEYLDVLESEPQSAWKRRPDRAETEGP